MEDVVPYENNYNNIELMNLSFKKSTNSKIKICNKIVI